MQSLTIRHIDNLWRFSYPHSWPEWKFAVTEEASNGALILITSEFALRNWNTGHDDAESIWNLYIYANARRLSLALKNNCMKKEKRFRWKSRLKNLKLDTDLKIKKFGWTVKIITYVGNTRGTLRKCLTFYQPILASYIIIFRSVPN